MKKCLPITILLLVFVMAIKAQGPAVTLKVNMAPGDKFLYTNTANLNIDQSVGGQQVHVATKIGITYLFSVVNDSTGWVNIAAGFRNINMNMDANGMNFKFNTDSANTDTSGEMATLTKVFSAMNRSGFYFSMSERGEIGSVRGIKEMADSVVAATGLDSATTSAVMSQAFNEQAFKQNLEQAFKIYPPGPVKTGDIWSNSSSLVSNGLPMHADNTYTLESVTGNVAAIKIVTKTTTPPGTNVKGMAIDMAGTLDGTINIDIKSGMPISGYSNLNADVTVHAQGQDVPMKLNVKTTMTSKKL